MSLNGLNGYVLSSTSNRGISNQVSVEAWVNTTAFKYQWVLGKYDRYGAERGYHLIIKDGKAAFAGRDGSGIYRLAGYSSVNVSDGKWHHLAGVCDGSTWSIYVDGILQGSITTNYSGTSLTNDAPFAIGKYFVYDDEYYEGRIDEVRVWKKALTQEEIRENMCAKLPPSPDLVAYFNFDETGSETVKDMSNQKLDGTLQNTSSSVALRTSGAPIGDKSAYRYTANWQSQVVELREGDDSFTVAGLGAETQGIHIYHVAALPNTTAGIPNPDQAAGYFGVFKVSGTEGGYSVQYHSDVASCSQSLFRRPDNAATVWAKVAEASLTDPLTHNSSDTQGEYVIISSECLVIPNIITPNGDGKNDTFVALGIEENTMQLHIFDRLGKSVYQTTQYDNSWSATDMPAGTYFYRFTSPRTQKVYKGWVQVVR